MLALHAADSAAPLALYDAMVTAIAECSRVDEVKDLRDKAMALEVYYRQALNLEAERQAVQIRLRAERRVGALLKELGRATPAERAQAGGNAKAALSDGETKHPPDPYGIAGRYIANSPYAEALDRTGISRQSAHRFQALADIPELDFEAALAAPEKPSTTGLLRAANPEPRVSDEALWLWGRLRDFERDGYFNADIPHLLEKMTDPMRADVARLAPLVREFLVQLEMACEPA